MADPKFYYQVNLHQAGAINSITAPLVQNLPTSNSIRALVVVLYSDERGHEGMFLWANDQRKWRMCLSPEMVSKGVIDGYQIDIYYGLEVPEPITNPDAIIFRNGSPFSSTDLLPGKGLIYTVMTPVAAGGAGTVKSVNGQLPDVNGDVVVTAADIAGVVVSINGTILPDAGGNIVLTAADVNAVDLSQVGVPGGLATLDSNGVIPISQIPPGILGGLQYQGTYDAATDTPPLPVPSQANKGFYWVTSVAGVYQGLDLKVGDWIVSNGTTYDEIDNQAGRVLSVNGEEPDLAGNVVVPFATNLVPGTVSVPASGGLLVNAAGELSINSAEFGSWTPSETVWVDYNGDALLGTGSINNPYSTIGQAIDNAAANAVIMVSPGSYAENVVLGSKPLYLKGWGNVGNYARTVITGNLVVGGANQIRIQDLGINYNGTQPCFSITSIGTTAGFKFENIVINANNTQTAILTNASAGAWTGSAYFVSLYVNAGTIRHAAGTGYVTTRMFPQDSAAVLEVHGGTVDMTEVWHLNSILHTAGTLQLFRARSIGTDPGVAAIVSTADNSAGNFLLMHKVSTWLTPATQTYVSKTGNCPYVIDGLTRNLVNDVFTGIMVPLKTDQDQDTVVSRAGTNYTAAQGAMLNTHLLGIDNALGLRLTQITSVGAGTSLVGVPTSGEVKSLVQGTGIGISTTATAVTISNTGVVALSSVTSPGATSLVNATSGQLKVLQGAGGLTITEAGGVITLTSSEASTGVTSLNGVADAVILDATAPLTVGTAGQTITLGYNGLRSLNGVIGAGVLLAGTGLGVSTAGQNITFTNEGVTFVQVASDQLTGGVILEAGNNVTFDTDTGTNTITINSSGSGGGGVVSLNTLQGALTLAQGAGIGISAMGTTITISATGAANPVASLNTLSGNLNLVGDNGITVSASGGDTLLITYDGGASVSVTSLNTQTGALNLVAGTNIAIDASTPGSITISNTAQALETVQNTVDATAGSVGLVADVGTAGVATVKKLLPSAGVSFVETATGVQILVTGGGGGGSVTSVAGIGPDGTGNVPLTGQDLGSLAADGTVPFTGDQDAASFSIDNLADPVAAQQPVTLNYLTTLLVDQGVF